MPSSDPCRRGLVTWPTYQRLVGVASLLCNPPFKKKTHARGKSGEGKVSKIEDKSIFADIYFRT